MNCKVKIIVLRTAGTNCDVETAHSFSYFGAQVDLVHINQLVAGAINLHDYHILAIPGGFTYGDDIMSGRILANELRFKLGNDINRFVKDGKLIIGICNGFQVLVRAGILPGHLADEATAHAVSPQSVTLTVNDSAKFEDRWVHLKVSGNSVWTDGLAKTIFIPVAHAEGKFIAKDGEILRQLKANNQVAFRYCDPGGQEPVYPQNPNGSVDNIAGITDRTGRILGLMPHPERHFLSIQHPFWTRNTRDEVLGQGAQIFENGIRYVRKNLLSKEQYANS